MGDFDRNSSPQQGNQTKKVAFVIILGVVFICVLGNLLFKHEPQSADAAPAADNTAIALPNVTSGETAQQARDALRNDPTASLLVGTARDAQEFSKMPHNPFVMSDAWRSALIRPADPVHPAALPRSFDPTPVAPHIALTLKIDDYKLASIVRQQDHFMAIINGNIVTAGMVVDGARVLDIHADRVILQNADDTTGPAVEIALVPKLK